ncbi:Short-chain dehydrogenase [Penicillium rolfsii]|nr:Short-chain dehydrogenase [Penicillium rolfsii]
MTLFKGGQAGIGKEITAQLLLHGIERVIVVARSENKFNIAYDEWRVRKGIELAQDDSRVTFVKCDLGDIEDVYAAAKKITQQTEYIHILICNAGLGIQPIAPLNTQGIDPIFTTNCIGHQILTTLLLPLLKKTTSTAPLGTRIVISSSSLHQLCRNLDTAALTRPTKKWPAIYDCVWRYARSKLANILFAKELTRRLLEDDDPAAKQVFVNSYFPGNVVTQQWQGWSEHLGKLVGAVVRCLGRWFGQSVEEAAATAIYLASSPEVSDREMRGEYYVPIAKIEEPTRLGRDEGLAREVWNWIDHRVAQTLGEDWQTEN